MKIKKNILAGLIMAFLIFCFTPVISNAMGPKYQEYTDIYFTKNNCVVYAEPTYTSMVLANLGANLPVQVIGYYTNGWYRINIGVICYVKMDSLTTAGEFGSVAKDDVMGQDVMKLAKEQGYKFHYISLNNSKLIEKSFINQYVSEKCILYAKIDNDFAVYFKMIYDDPFTGDIDLNYIRTTTVNADGSRLLTFAAPSELELKGAIANFVYKVGYDKVVDNYIKSVDTDNYNLMNTFYTEFSELSYAPVTQIGDMYIYEKETSRSLSDSRRLKMNDLRLGIKYLEYDQKDYRSEIYSKLRKDTEYIDYVLK